MRKDNETPGCLLLSGAYAIALLAIIIIGSCLVSCQHVKYIEVPVTTHDTVHHTTLRIDSIYNRDSIYVESYILGDTIYKNKYIERWRTKYNTLHDTLYIHRTDTVTIPKPAEKKLTKWQTYCLQLGNTMAIMLLLALLYGLYRLYKSIRKIIKQP